MYRKPRKVTQADIDAFEKQYPLYTGIGRLMITKGIWILADETDERRAHCGGSPANSNVHSTLHQAATSTRQYDHIKMSSAGRCGR
ncbi:MAG: hypothetical protein JXA08_04280 [Methanomicrobiaceae archaeon]|nr:hypothetical protein [Methanomicrobiaceae archaeon]